MQKWFSVIGIFTGLILPAFSATLEFDQDQYTVVPNEVFELRVRLDMDELAAGIQLPTNGLGGVGAAILYDTNSVVVASTNDMVLAPKLSFDGFAGPAPKRLGDGEAGAAGALAFTDLLAFTNEVFLTIQVQNIAPPGSNHTINLGFFFDDTRVNFVDFRGQILDNVITNFGSATITVVAPPPQIEVLSMVPPLGGLIGTLRVRSEQLTGLELQSNTNLLNELDWVRVGTVATTNSATIVSYTLPPGSDTNIFYRAAIPGR